MKSIITVVLSGGSGTRLWPASRESCPKPFMRLADGETLLHKTYSRAKLISPNVLTVTNADFFTMSEAVQQQAGGTGNFLLEPFGRNTAPAVGLSAKYVSQTYGLDSVMLVLAADHLISNQASFEDAVAKAVELAREGYLVSFGIVPTAPETGFGYIKRGEPLGAGNKVSCFIEKPDLERAEAYIASGQYLWNSGMFCFKAGVLLDELEKHAPELSTAMDSCWRAMQPLAKDVAIKVPAELFKKFPDISIDYAVMEKSDRIAVVPGQFGWSDVGSWDAIRALVQPDPDENRAVGEAVFIDTNNVFVQSENRLVATVGIKDLIIIDTPDALLVASPQKSQDVKKVVAQLKAANHEALKSHRTVARPWGTYTVLEEAPGFKIKRIEVKPGASLSLQMHRHRSEHWVVVSGTAKITNGEKEVIVKPNESTYIPAGQKHRLENPNSELCVMIEVQCGSYLGEDDIVRFDDKYGR